jgi:hypothetical protein
LQDEAKDGGPSAARKRAVREQPTGDGMQYEWNASTIDKARSPDVDGCSDDAR